MIIKISSHAQIQNVCFLICVLFSTVVLVHSQIKKSKKATFIIESCVFLQNNGAEYFILGLKICLIQ